MTQANKWADLAGKFPAGGKETDKGLQVKVAADGIVAELLAGGKEAVVGVVAGLKPREQGGDSKLRHALHALVMHVASLGDDGPKQRVAEALASTLEGDRPAEVKSFVLRQIQLIGDKSVAPGVGKRLGDQALCEPATQALLAMGEGATEQLRKALPSAKGQCLVTIAQALGVVRDATSAPALRKLATHDDREVRLASAWALANIGDEGATTLLLKASDSDGYERIKATSACLLLAENLAGKGKNKEAASLYRSLQKLHTREDEVYLRTAVERGLAKVAG